MNLHEYQAKALLAQYGVTVPRGQVVTAAAEVEAAGTAVGGTHWVVKAQVHAGGRGKAGGIKKASGMPALHTAVAELLARRLVTPQTGADGQPIGRVLIEQAAITARELYLACLIDRAHERVALIASAAGGMDIEEVAARTPEKILKVWADPVIGLQAFQCRRLAFGLALSESQVGAFVTIGLALYRLLSEHDLSLVEINPLIVTDTGALVALDAKINIDDNALYRQKPLAALRDDTQEDPKEQQARAFDLNYIALTGNIGCMVNGAGLAMATMDLIQLHGGAPANFLDVGGGTTAAKVAQAFKLICSDTNVRAVLVNIFGGIVRCDLIAEGIIEAVREVGLSLPVIVRLEGTNADAGRALLQASGLRIVAAASLTEAAQLAVAAATPRPR